MASTDVRRIVRPGMRGLDVHAAKRAIARLLQDGRLTRLEGRRKGETEEQAERRRETFQPSYVADVKLAQLRAGLPMSGVIGPELEKFLHANGFYDARALELERRYADSLKPKLVRPRQGWSSLHRSLWEVYSVGRSAPYSFSDLGTYNPASRLPSGRPSDHSVHPAVAFDLGIDPDLGWAHELGREYVLRVAREPEVEYVILGDRIVFGRTIRRYSAGGHLNHIHVSGVR